MQDAEVHAIVQQEARRREESLQVELADARGEISAQHAHTAAMAQRIERAEAVQREAALVKQEVGVLRAELLGVQAANREADARAIEDAPRLSALEQAKGSAEQRHASLAASTTEEHSKLERSIREVREEFQDALALAQTEMQGTLSGAIARFEAAREVSCIQRSPGGAGSAARVD